MKTILLIASLLFPIHSFACPLGPGETELTLSRVMRNFGRYLMPADLMVQKATMGGGQDVPNADLERSIRSLDVVLTCVDRSLTDRSEALLPRRARELQGEARAAYLRMYASRLRDFRATVVNYQNEFTRLLGLPVPGRDFLPAKGLSKAVQEAANRAHEALGGGSN